MITRLPSDIIFGEIIPHLHITSIINMIRCTRSLYQLRKCLPWNDLWLRDFSRVPLRSSSVDEEYKKAYSQIKILKKIDFTLLSIHRTTSQGYYDLGQVKGLCHRLQIKVGKRTKRELVIMIRDLLLVYSSHLPNKMLEQVEAEKIPNLPPLPRHLARKRIG